MRFSGDTYDHGRDGERLKRQYARTWALMFDGKWRTLAEISAATGDPQASISARLRDMRKRRFGAHTVNRRYLGDGLWSYQLEARGKEAA